MSIEANPVGVKCNLKCAYCYEDPMRHAGNVGGTYDLEAIKRGLEKENYRFALFGGEPLLVPIHDLEELFKFGLEKFGGSGIQTNGTLITEAHLELFKKYKVGVGLSMDGPGDCNNSRWAGTLEKTRELTAVSEWALRALLAGKGYGKPSLIVTLYRGNAVGKRLEQLKDWLRELDGLGLRGVRLHLLEVDDEAVRRNMALTEDENVNVLMEMAKFQDELKVMRFDLFGDMVKLLLGTDQLEGGTSCIWNACDPMTTNAVRGVNGDGDNVNCGRTNKDGVDYGKADRAGFERQLALHATPFENGGCKDCRFFIQCKGQCPGTAIGGDWRNRTDQCGTWFRVFEHLERQLVNAGKKPLSVSPLRPAIENVMLESWAAGRNISVGAALAVATGRMAMPTSCGDNQEHGDHWDAPHGHNHDDNGFTVHGDNGTTTTHGDIPHGDSDAE